MRLAWLWAAIVLFAAMPARAQVIEDIEVTREGPTAVVSVRFAAKVQFLRSSTNTRRTLVQVYFRFVEREVDGGRTLEEFRRAAPTALVPKFTVHYPIQPDIGPQRVDVEFEKPVQARVRAGSDNRSIRIEMEAAAAPAAPPTAVPPAGARVPTPTPPGAPAAPVGPEAIEAQAQLDAARASVEAGRLDEAIATLNALLNKPPTPATRGAQELIGVARERRGDLDRARAEYELFLKLYPTGADADRVRSSLARLRASPLPGIAAEAVAASPTAPPASAVTTWGTLSQYYYGGQSRSDQKITIVTPATNATTIDTLSLTATDQSALVTNVDANLRYVSGSWDGRLVLRDTQTASFLAEQPSRNRLSALFAESRHVPTATLVRVGRQFATIGGLLGRFDGVVAGTEFAPRWRASVLGGRPVDVATGETKPAFAAVAIDADGLAGRWSGTAYALQQRVEGHSDRRAVGTEVRYFDSERSLIGFLDYDLQFRAVNIGMLQGTWQAATGTSFSLLADYRRTPSLQLANAVFAGRGLTLAEYLETFGETQARRDADGVSAASKLFYVGFTHPITGKWQVGADVRVSSLSATREIGLLPSTPGTGTVYTYSGQLIGTSLFGNGDVTVANASVLSGAVNRAASLGLVERLQFADRWVFEPSIRWYRQRDDNDIRLERWSPGLKATYRVGQSVFLDAEATWERTRTTGGDAEGVTTRVFYFLGYRWVF